MNRFLSTIILALASLSAWPQAAPISGSVINQYGQPVAGANVRICSVTSTGTPCTPPAAIFSDFNLTQPTGNPTQTDVNGNFTVYVGALSFPNLYTVQAFPVPANPSGLPYTWVEPGPWCSLGGCAFSGPISAPQITTPVLISPNVSKGLVLYASGSGCALNSNLSTGGGTDDSVCIQSILNKLNAVGGGTLVQDGVSLISAVNVPGGPTGQTNALQMGPNTTLRCTIGGGFYLANNSNVWMIGNAISGNPNSALYQPNFEIDDCTFNENGANQSRYEQGNSNNQWVGGMWFGGFNGLFLNNVNILNARTFAFYITNGESFYGHDLAAIQTAGEGSGGNNHDGLHFDGTLSNVYVTNFLDEYGDDDALAFNTDEGVYNYNNSPLAWQFARFPQSGGAISNVTIDNVKLVGVNDALRWIGYSTPNGVATVTDIVLENISGIANNFISACCGDGVTAIGGVTIDNWDVSPTGSGGSNLYTPPSADPLWVSNVINTVPVVPGSGSAQAVSPFLTIGNGGLSVLNLTYNSTPLPTLSLDNTGNLFFGFSQPQTIFRVGSTNALYLNNTSGSGYTDTLQVPSTTLLQVVGPAAFTGTIQNGSNTVPNVGTPTVGQATCVKAAGPPVVIGYCSTVVGSGGACTCN